MDARQSDGDSLERLARDVARLGVQEACRLHGIHRSTWYRRSKRETRFSPLTSSARQQLMDEVRSIALDQPSWGCDRIAYYLSFSGIRASSPTIQKLLIGMGLGRRGDRERAANTGDTAP
jgi:hypothetical protein